MCFSMCLETDYNIQTKLLSALAHYLLVGVVGHVDGEGQCADGRGLVEEYADVVELEAAGVDVH